MRIGLCLVDQGWLTDLVRQFCRQSGHAALLMPARGHGITASQKPVSEYDRKRGDRIGHHWWMPSVKGRRALRHVEIDTNDWKTFMYEHLGMAKVPAEDRVRFCFRDVAAPLQRLDENWCRVAEALG